jgi:predicted N-acyltransferase
MDGREFVEVSVLPSISGIAADEWDACACPEGVDGPPIDPFTTYRFLKAIEDSGSVGTGTGWQPRHLVLREGEEVIGTMPLYAKSHSQGEYVFDHNWAHAYERAGGRYYPKLQSAAPFTPATGRRFLCKPGHEETARPLLVRAALQLANENRLSSLHITFCTEEEKDALGELGLLERYGQQFHWINAKYASFEAFLEALSSRKRKTIRKERRTAQTFGGRIHQLQGNEITPEHLEAFWVFYQDTGARKWGTPYLTRDFFNRVHESLRDDILLIMCERDGRWVAGALNFIGRNTLYGRYWGCIEDHSCLHFEVCYYQAIDFAIKHGLSRVEAGAQGSHKLARGYMPVPTYSLHYMMDEGFQQAVSDYLAAERCAVDEEIEVLTSYGPFRKTVLRDEDA